MIGYDHDMDNPATTIKTSRIGNGRIRLNGPKLARRAWYRQKGFWSLTFLALPALSFLFVFNIVPLYGLILPFQDFSPITGLFGSPWVGFANFKFLFNSETLFEITRNTVTMNLLFIVFNTVIGVTLAIFMTEVGKGFVKLFQTILFIPYLLSWVIISFATLAFLNYDRGIINSVLEYFNKPPVNWYADPKPWPFIILFAEVWRIAGYAALLYYAALMGIGAELYEAAAIDGAGKLRQIFTISIPGIMPVIIIVNVLAVGRVFNGDMGLFYNLPLNQSILYPATDVIDTYVFRALTTLNDFGMSAATGMYQAVCGFVLVMLTNWVVKKYDNDFALF